ncbi:MAG: DUF1801 domain-containing protein [Bacteroidia bacterium]|nr:DUF1801 domain-containing protein [Bacteroidia bacterium]
MAAMQSVKFRSIEEFLDYLPDHERVMVDILREIIWECIPECREKLSYNVPYYWRHSRICFIWPSSVPWGKVKLHGVQLGFCEGNRLNDDIGFLEKGNRKQVYIKTFMKPEEIQPELIRAYLYEAVEVDKSFR